MDNTQSEQSARKPIAVVISDIHYSLQTLKVADAATRQAVAKANELQVPLVVAGDAHDSKANMRGEVVAVMIRTFKLCQQEVYMLVGNHSRINERSKEHALEFMRPYATVIDEPAPIRALNAFAIPYEHDPEVLKQLLSTIPSGSRLIMHQGVCGSNMGDYVQDKSALPKEYFADFRVISGHYHARQDIKCGRPREGAVGLFSYVGNPYSLTFGEANDPEKGFQILMDDGLLEFVPTNLRRHIKINMFADGDYEWNWKQPEVVKPDDFVWVKATGPRYKLKVLDKKAAAKLLGLSGDFRFETIPIDDISAPEVLPKSNNELLDAIIDSATKGEQNTRIKSLWRSLCE